MKKSELKPLKKNMENKKIFIDTNVILESLCRRSQAEEANLLLELIADEIINGYISSGSFHTITYYAEKGLKQIGYSKEDRISILREYLNNLLDQICVVKQGNESLRLGVNNTSFAVLEDSYQYQSALDSGCDVLVTINVGDYKDCNGETRIMSLKEFAERYSANS